MLITNLKRKGCTLITIGDKKSIIFVGAPLKRVPSKIMQTIKSIIAKEMFKAFPERRKTLWGGFFWSEGGYIGTVGEGTSENIVKRYIKNQGDELERKQYKQMKLFKLRT